VSRQTAFASRRLTPPGSLVSRSMIEDDCDIELGYYRGSLERLFSGLEAMNLDGAIIELDGDSEEMSQLAEARTCSRPELAEANRRARGRRIGPFVFGFGSTALPLEQDTVAKLRSMLDRHADPEIAIEVTVRDEYGDLVQAPDIGDNEIWVSRRLQSASIDALRSALGDELRPS
jgi:hypothetical protein